MTDDMGEQDHGAAQDKQSRLQFGLRPLLVWVGACSILFALLAWGGEAMSRAPEAFLVIGLGLLGLGVFRRRIGMVLLGIAVVCGLLLGVTSFTNRPENRSDVTHGVARFRVVDEQTGTPVPGVAVRLVSVNTQEGTTDADGCVTLTGCFRPDPIDGFPGATQPDYRDCVVEVDAEGYEPAIRPYDQLPSDEGKSVIKLAR